MTAPTLLTANELLDLLDGLGDIPKFAKNDDLYETSGPRVHPSSMLPHDAAGREIEAWVWDDGLMLVSPEVFKLL
jgi:hypothetical protein